LRLAIILGSESGKQIALDVSKLRLMHPEAEISVNSTPDDGVAIYDCSKINQLPPAWPSDKPLALGMCEHAKIEIKQGPLTGDFLSAASDYIGEGLVDQPPEDETSLTLG